MRRAWIVLVLALGCGGQAAPPVLGQLTPELRDRARAACGDRFVDGEVATEAVVLLPPAVFARPGGVRLVHAGCLAYPAGGVTGGLWLIYEPQSAALFAATIDVADAGAIGPWADALERAGLDGALATRARAAAHGATREARDGRIVIVTVGVNGVYRIAASVDR